MSAFNTPWLRLWSDMPNDPKWRTIARLSGQTIGHVMAVYLHLLVNASNADERGTLYHFHARDVASALDLDTAQVEAILSAMQGIVLDGDRVSGWAARQPNREDSAAERAKTWRESQKLAAAPVVVPVISAPTNVETALPVDNSVNKPVDNLCANATERTRTQTNANERSETDTDTETDKDTQTARVRDGHQLEALDSAAPAQVEAVCAALKAAGIDRVSPSNPELAVLVSKGADAALFAQAAHKAKAKGKGLAYALGIVRVQMEDAQNIARQTFTNAASVGSVANITVPSKPGPCKALAEMLADDLITTGPPEHIRAWLAKTVAEGKSKK